MCMLNLSHLIIITMTTIAIIMITTTATIAPITPPIIEDSDKKK